MSDVLRSEGQRRLRLLGLSLNDIAGAMGVSKQCVSGWKSGRTSPGTWHARSIENAYQIPTGAWHRTAGWSGDAPGAPARRDDSPAPRGVIDQLADLLASTRAARMATTRPGDLAQLARAEGKLIERLAVLEAARRFDAMLDDPRTVTEHPKFIAFRAELLKALAPFPEVHATVCAALASVGALPESKPVTPAAVAAVVTVKRAPKGARKRESNVEIDVSRVAVRTQPAPAADS